VNGKVCNKHPISSSVKVHILSDTRVLPATAEVTLTKKFLKLLKFVIFLFFPRVAYIKWNKRTSEDSERGYLVNLDSISNQYLWEVLRKVTFQSLLEIGSNCGNRIMRFAEENPTKNVVGIDLNVQAVKLGNQIALARNIPNISFLPIDARTFHLELSEKFDIILTWATLLVLPPRHHKKVLEEMITKASTLILIERGHDANSSFLQRFILQMRGFPNWIYDYREIADKYGLVYEERRVPRHIWSPGGGFGKMIIMSKSHKSLQ